MLDNGWKIELYSKLIRLTSLNSCSGGSAESIFGEWENGRNVTFLACDVWGKIQKGSQLEGRIAK